MSEETNKEETKKFNMEDVIEEFKNVYVQLETLKRNLAAHRHETDGKPVIVIPIE